MTSFKVKLLAGLGIMALLGTVPKPVLAQPILRSDWPTSAFAALHWIRAEDQHVLYQSEVFLSTDGNQITVYNTFKQDPFGSLARCGGLGCDLERGDLVATLTFTFAGNRTFVVNSATGSARFMQGARCQVEGTALPFLSCYSQQGPNSWNFPSVIRLIPGT